MDREWVVRKYRADQPRVPAGDPRGGQWTDGPSINWSRDPDASGIVPMQQGEEYYYRTVQMDPRDFLALTPGIPAGDSSIEWMASRIGEGQPIGPPWLAVDWNRDTQTWAVTSHEGRHRAQAAIALGATRIPVDFLFNGGYRARDITDEMLHRPVSKQHLRSELLEPVIGIGE